jgi:hypothetical protein
MTWQNSKKPKLLLAHFSKDELQALDTIQGGPSIDPATDIRDYRKLGELIEIPQIREIFLKVKNEVLRDLKPDDKLDSPLKGAYQVAPKILPPFKEVKPENPMAEKIGEEGIGGDTEIAWIPTNLAAFFIEINNGTIRINPYTKFLMFGWGNFFKSIVRIAAPIAAIAAAPFTGGSSLGLLGKAGVAAMASGLAHIATGAKPGEALRAGILSGATQGLGSWGAGMTGLSPAITHGLARTGLEMAQGEKFKDAAMHGLTHGVIHRGVGKIGEAFNPQDASSKGMIHTAIGSLPKNNPTLVAHGIENIGSKISNFFSNPAVSGAGSLLPLAAMGALSYKGQKEAYQHENQRREEAKREAEKLKHDTGYYLPWRRLSAKDIKVRPNPEFFNPTDWERETGAYPSPFLPEEEGDMPYRKGGHVKNPIYHDQNKVHSEVEGVLVKGKGKGQQDLIKTSVPENSYIVDASATSMFGDGSSDAGAKVLKEFEDQIKRKAPKHHVVQLAHHISSTAKQLPVWLSDSEYKFDPLTVSLLGKGNSRKGAQLLKQMIENIREEKSKKGAGLPLKAKSPWHYLENRG